MSPPSPVPSRSSMKAASRRLAALLAPTALIPVRGVLAALGAVAAVTGTAVALRGPAAIPGGQPGAASNDSVLRFYAVWWAAQSVPLFRLAVDPTLPERELRRICGLTVLGGLARLAAVRASGRPHPLFQALTAVELVLPPLLVMRRRHAIPGG